MTIKAKSHHSRKPLISKRLKQQIESTDQREVAAIKKQNITSSKRKRANNNVTDVFQRPSKMRKKTAGSQKAERAIKGKASLSTEEKKTKACLVKEIKRLAKLEHKSAQAMKQLAEAREKVQEAEKNFLKVSKKRAVNSKSCKRSDRRLTKQSL